MLKDLARMSKEWSTDTHLFSVKQNTCGNFHFLTCCFNLLLNRARQAPKE